MAHEQMILSEQELAQAMGGATLSAGDGSSNDYTAYIIVGTLG